MKFDMLVNTSNTIFHPILTSSCPYCNFFRQLFTYKKLLFPEKQMLRTLNKKHQITENSEPPKPPPEILKTSAQSSSQKSRGIGTFEPKTIPRDIVDPKKTERRAEKVGINGLFLKQCFQLFYSFSQCLSWSHRNFLFNFSCHFEAYKILFAIIRCLKKLLHKLKSRFQAEI